MNSEENTPESHISAPQGNGEQAQRKKSLQESFWENFKEFPQRFSAFFAGSAFVVSCLACLFSFCQVRNSGKAAEAAKQSSLSAKESVEISKKAMRVSNRPYMIINGVQLIRFENWNKIELVVKTKNFGRTPAIKTEVMARIDCFPTDFTETPPYEAGVDTVKTSIPLGAEMPFHLNLENHRRFTQDEIFKLDNGKLFLFAYGIIKYTDIFGDSLSTRFNFKYNGKSFEVHPKYNDIK